MLMPRSWDGLSLLSASSRAYARQLSLAFKLFAWHWFTDASQSICQCRGLKEDPHDDCKKHSEKKHLFCDPDNTYSQCAIMTSGQCKALQPAQRKQRQQEQQRSKERPTQDVKDSPSAARRSTSPSARICVRQAVSRLRRHKIRPSTRRLSHRNENARGTSNPRRRSGIRGKS